MKKISVLFMFSLLFLPKLQAQEHLQIKKAYDKYAKEKGSVFVQLSKDILSQGDTKINFYKSMVIEENRERRDLILDLMEADRTVMADLSEQSFNGKVTSLIYRIAKEKEKEDGENEYVLYKNIKGKISLVYIWGEFPMNELEQELNKLKDLFIYVKKKKKK